jgi:hypothetical protein
MTVIYFSFDEKLGLFRIVGHFLQLMLRRSGLLVALTEIGMFVVRYSSTFVSGIGISNRSKVLFELR